MIWSSFDVLKDLNTKKITWFWYCLNYGVLTSLRATAIPAMECMWGPPWSPGKTAASILAFRSYLI